jgi:hypothetical protein
VVDCAQANESFELGFAVGACIGLNLT